MSEQIAVARVNRTGALVRLHDGNRGILRQAGIVETTATKDPDTGRLVETNGADFTTIVASSSNLVRIGEAIQANITQRGSLLTAALKITGGQEYLERMGLYDPKTDEQYVDQNALLPANADTTVSTGVKPLSKEQLEGLTNKVAKPQGPPEKSTQTPKTRSKKKSVSADDLSEL